MKRVSELTTDKTGPHVLLLAGVHGDEYEPMVALAELATELEGALLKGTVTIDPLVNEGAFARGNRIADDGLDLARICPGNVEGTVTERAAHRVSERILRADVLVDLHTGGKALDIYPMAGYLLHPEEVVLERQRQLAQATGMPLIWGTDYRPQGRTLSVARDAGIPAIYLEYGGGSGFRKQVVADYKAAIRGVLTALDMLAATDNADTGWVYWLEDHRPDSGYLQAKMPAPASGIFIADVSVGDWVTVGQRFGCILDPETGKTHELWAEEAGLVFLLRQEVSVKAGDALGGVIQVTLQEKMSINDGKGSHN